MYKIVTFKVRGYTEPFYAIKRTFLGIPTGYLDLRTRPDNRYWWTKGQKHFEDCLTSSIELADEALTRVNTPKVPKYTELPYKLDPKPQTQETKKLKDLYD